MLHVLLVEDNELDTLLVQDAFDSHGAEWALHIVVDGDEAVTFLQRHTPRPDIVLLDRNLPGMNGPEVLAFIREHPEWQDTLVAALIGSEREEAWWSDQMRADVYLTKPVNPDAVLTAWQARLASAPRDA